MRLSLRTLLLTGAIGAACVLAPVVVIARQPATKTIYMTVLDNKGAPITDLGAAELEVKAGGKAMEIVRMQPGQMAFRIAVIVSDAGTGGFQQGIANFMQKLLGQAEFSLISVITQPQVVSDYSSEGAMLKEAVRRVGPRGRARGAGAQLMEAIQEATRSVASDGRRPVILVLRAGGEAVTTLEGDEVREDLRKSGAVLYVVSTVGAQRPNAPSARTGISERAGADAGRGQREQHPEHRAGARRRVEGIGRTSRSSDLDHARAGARTGRGRAPEPVLGHLRAPGRRQAERQAVDLDEAQGRAHPGAGAAVYAVMFSDRALIMSRAAATVSFGGLP